MPLSCRVAMTTSYSEFSYSSEYSLDEMVPTNLMPIVGSQTCTFKVLKQIKDNSDDIMVFFSDLLVKLLQKHYVTTLLSLVLAHIGLVYDVRAGEIEPSDTGNLSEELK